MIIVINIPRNIKLKNKISKLDHLFAELNKELQTELRRNTYVIIRVQQTEWLRIHRQIITNMDVKFIFINLIIRKISSKLKLKKK